MAKESSKNKPAKSGSETNQENAMPTISWDDSKMGTTYANVCNVTSTREEVTLLFGTNQSWNTEKGEVSVALSDRIILNPYAAKRMSMLLNQVIDEYEGRFGSLLAGRATDG